MSRNAARFDFSSDSEEKSGTKRAANRRGIERSLPTKTPFVEDMSLENLVRILKERGVNVETTSNKTAVKAEPVREPASRGTKPTETKVAPVTRAELPKKEEIKSPAPTKKEEDTEPKEKFVINPRTIPRRDLDEDMEIAMSDREDTKRRAKASASTSGNNNVKKEMRAGMGSNSANQAYDFFKSKGGNKSAEDYAELVRNNTSVSRDLLVYLLLAMKKIPLGAEEREAFFKNKLENDLYKNSAPSRAIKKEWSMIKTTVQKWNQLGITPSWGSVALAYQEEFLTIVLRAWNKGRIENPQILLSKGAWHVLSMTEAMSFLNAILTSLRKFTMIFDSFQNIQDEDDARAVWNNKTFDKPGPEEFNAWFDRYLSGDKTMKDAIRFLAFGIIPYGTHIRFNRDCRRSGSIMTKQETELMWAYLLFFEEFFLKVNPRAPRSALIPDTANDMKPLVTAHVKHVAAFRERLTLLRIAAWGSNTGPRKIEARYTKGDRSVTYVKPIREVTSVSFQKSEKTREESYTIREKKPREERSEEISSDKYVESETYEEEEPVFPEILTEDQIENFKKMIQKQAEENKKAAEEYHRREAEAKKEKEKERDEKEKSKTEEGEKVTITDDMQDD